MSETPPSAPPADPDGLVAWLDALDGMDPGERRRSVQRARKDASGPAEAYVAVLEARARGDEIDALPLLDALREAGLDEAAAVDALVRLCEARDLQAEWTDWEEVEDRSEVRIRLKVLARVDALDEALAGFLGFFFRASDPELYRWAAHAMGRHHAQTPAVRESLEAWCRERGLDAVAPARLDGTRGPRRLAFLQAGAATRTTAEAGLGDPLETVQAFLDRDPADVDPVDHVAALRVAQVLVEADACPPQVAADLLDRPFETRGRPPETRLVDAWSSLFVEVREDADEAARERLDRAWARTASGCLRAARASDGVGGRVAGLQALDQALAAIVQLGPETARALAEDLDALTPLEAALVRQRLAAWAARAGLDDPPLDPVPASDGGFEDAPEPVRAVLEHAWRSTRTEDLIVDAGQERTVTLVDTLLDLFADEEAWNEASRRTRAIVLFQLLDLLRNEPVPAERLHALLDRHEVTTSLPTASARAGRRAAIAHLVARVVAWEGADGHPLLDARTLHEVDDERLLCGFVPTDRWLPAMTTLADALEHRFRWRLRREETFRPVAYLARVTVRRPHPGLFDALAGVSRDRAYRRTPDGDSFPLTRVAEALAEQARLALEDGPADAIAEAWPVRELAPWDPTVASLVDVRQTLARLAEAADPAAIARGLADVVGRVDARGRAREDTLLGVLDALHERDRPFARTGEPPWTPDTLDERMARTSEQAARLASLAEALEAEASVAGTRALLGDLRPAVARLIELVGEGLGLAETRLLEDRVQRLDALQEDWVAALSLVDDAGLEGAVDPDAWAAVLDTVTERWEGRARGNLLVRLWRAWTGLEVVPADPADEAGWTRGIALVHWGLNAHARTRWTPDERGAWDAAVADTYEALLEAAMEANREDRVLELLREEGFAPARRVETVTETLEAAEDWCLDRYRLGASLEARRSLAKVRGSRGPTWPGHALTFLGHFSPVWSALLVGAILMLDFGDAWVELAETGAGLEIAVTCAIGVLGAYLYVARDLDAKVAHPVDTPPGLARLRMAARAAGFTVACVLVAAAITGFLWLLLRDTSVVVRGPMAVAHVAVWTAFALFVGIVFGLVIQKGM